MELAFSREGTKSVKTPSWSWDDRTEWKKGQGKWENWREKKENKRRDRSFCVSATWTSASTFSKGGTPWLWRTPVDAKVWTIRQKAADKLFARMIYAEWKFDSTEYLFCACFPRYSYASILLTRRTCPRETITINLPTPKRNKIWIFITFTNNRTLNIETRRVEASAVTFQERKSRYRE